MYDILIFERSFIIYLLGIEKSEYIILRIIFLLWIIKILIYIYCYGFEFGGVENLVKLICCLLEVGFVVKLCEFIEIFWEIKFYLGVKVDLRLWIAE